MVSIDYRAMAVPVKERLQTVESYRPRLPGRLRVSIDRGFEGCWVGARKAWCMPATGTHVCLLQDDCELADDFHGLVLEAVERFPDEILTLFLTTSLVAKAYRLGYSWLSVPLVNNGLAFIMPAGEVPLFVSWCDAKVRPEVTYSDCRVSMWALSQGRLIYCTVPNLVQHKNELASAAGHPQRIFGRERVSQCFEPGFDARGPVYPALSGWDRKQYDRFLME